MPGLWWTRLRELVDGLEAREIVTAFFARLAGGERSVESVPQATGAELGRQEARQHERSNDGQNFSDAFDAAHVSRWAECSTSLARAGALGTHVASSPPAPRP